MTDHNETRTNSPSATIIESSRLVPWMLFACIMSGLALGISSMTVYTQATAYRELERDNKMVADIQAAAYRELERENRLLQLKVDEFRMALVTAGINPNPHVKGESK